MSIGYTPSSVAPDAIVRIDFPCLFPRSWPAKTLSESPLSEIHCGSMSLGCCVSHAVWTWKMFKHEGQMWKQVYLWEKIIYQAPYEEVSMTEEEYIVHEKAAWEAVKKIPHTPHIGYATLQQKEQEQWRQQWEWNRFMKVY